MRAPGGPSRERYAAASLTIQLPVSLTRREEIDESSFDRLETAIKERGLTRKRMYARQPARHWPRG